MKTFSAPNQRIFLHCEEHGDDILIDNYYISHLLPLIVYDQKKTLIIKRTKIVVPTKFVHDERIPIFSKE